MPSSLLQSLGLHLSCFALGLRMVLSLPGLRMIWSPLARLALGLRIVALVRLALALLIRLGLRIVW